VTHSRLAVADYLALRFAIAAVVLLAVRPAAVRRLPPAGPAPRRRAGSHVRRRAPAADRGFAAHVRERVRVVTGMYVVFTPLLAAVILRHRIERSPAGSRCRAGAGTGCVCSSWRWSRARWHWSCRPGRRRTWIRPGGDRDDDGAGVRVGFRRHTRRWEPDGADAGRGCLRGRGDVPGRACAATED